MRPIIALALLVPFLSGCEGLSQRIDESRQDRCQRAEWAKVGERDGYDNYVGMETRYESICGDLYQPGPYKEGFAKGAERRPRPQGN
jgi:hypothetical protein